MQHLQVSERIPASPVESGNSPLDLEPRLVKTADSKLVNCGFQVRQPGPVTSIEFDGTYLEASVNS